MRPLKRGAAQKGPGGGGVSNSLASADIVGGMFLYFLNEPRSVPQRVCFGGIPPQMRRRRPTGTPPPLIADTFRD